MAVTVPDWADTLLDLIGVSWPNVDEDAYRDMADSLREFAEDLEDDGQLANNHVQRLLSSGHGEALDALNEHWGKVKDKHLKDVTSAARTIAGALDTAAGAIEVMKGAALVQLGYLASEAGIAISLIPVTGGLSALIGAGAMRATQEVVKRLIKECVEEAVGYVIEAMTEPAVAALESLAADLVVQLGATALGLQDGVDLNQAKQAGKDGFNEGVQGSKEAMHLASAGGSGGGGGKGKGVHIEHGEHDHASTRLNGVSVNIHGRTAGKLTKAKTHHGRTRGRDSIAEAIDPVADKAMDALEKAVRTMGNHVGKTLPKAVKQISKDHKNNDDDIRARFAKQRKGDDGRSGKRNAGDKGRGPSSRTKPDSLRGAKNEPRRNGIELSKKTCKNDPIDIATGEMTLAQTDLSLPGVLPLVLQRTHLSEYRYGQWFGRSWASTLDERLEPDPVGPGAVWAREDGSLLAYPSLPLPGGDPVMPVEGPRLALAHGGQYEDTTTYTVTESDTGQTWSFTGSPYRSSSAYWLTELTDLNDNRIIFSRRPDGSPTTVSHDGGYTAQITTEDQRITALSLRTPEGPVTVATYGYDERGNLNAVVNSSGLPLRFGYDEHDRINSWTDRNDSTFTYVYDAVGRVVRTIGPAGYLSSTFEYDAEARITRYTDSTGATTAFLLNELLQVVAETDPLGNTVSQSWDRYDRLLSRTDTHGRTASWVWDERGNLTAAHESDGSVTTAEYNELDLPTVVTGPDGAVWRREFDDRGNHVALIAPDGTTTRFEYDGRGAILTITDATGGVERFQHDGVGLPIAQSDTMGSAATIIRDAFGRPLTVTDPLGATTTLEWNVEGLLTRRVEPDGTEQSWTYDAEGNRLTETVADGRTTRYEYTHFDQPTARTGPDGARYEFSYDTELRLRQVRNSVGLHWQYRYDIAGRVTSETDFDGRTLHYSYDAAGRLLTRTNPLGQTITHHLDNTGRLTAKDVDGTVTAFTYDRAGRLTSARSPHSTLTLERDPRGRPVAETVDGRTTRFTYDSLGHRTGRVTPSGVTTAAEYDAAGNRTRMDLAGHVFAFAHDPLGRELSRSFGSLDRPVTLSTVWDTSGRVGERSLTAQGRMLRSRAYTYRADDQLLAVTDLLSGQERRFQLDAAGRPLRVEAQGWSETYVYDGEGNQTSAQWPDQAPYPEARGERIYSGTRVESAGGLHYTYDAAGRIVERRKKRLSRKPDIWRYQWDPEDRLVSCSTPDGTLWTYAYDALGRRTKKRKHAPDGQVVAEIAFSWDETRIAEQTDSATGTVLTWEHDGHRPLAQAEHRLRDTEGTAPDAHGQDRVDSRFFAIVTDLVGTPTELVDETGEIAWHSRATQWGTTTWNSDASAYTPLRFPGQYADPETGLHYNYFRHYDPEAGRYVTPDPLGLAPSPNPVGYVANPATGSDPLGLAPCLQGLEDMAHRIAKVFPQERQRFQTVAVVHANTPQGPAIFVSGTSRTPLSKAQEKLAREMGLIPLPKDQYLPKPPKGARGGHAEQNIVHFLNRMHKEGESEWLPTHGAASRSVCPDVCAPLIRPSGGRLTGPVYQEDGPTHRRQFHWPGRYTEE
ncbi:DUF6531 domain-containing protein [Streptomyces sp. NPDC048479]|uniref:DUF6531 domain-containing protein n=1 Tax=Streptomyces sp. NPDC048479 TaxID=3154725 RepID=UPI0034377FC7